jgi:hypothetical protein
MAPQRIHNKELEVLIKDHSCSRVSVNLAPDDDLWKLQWGREDTYFDICQPVLVS